MQVVNDTYVSETSVRFEFSDGSSVTLEEVRPQCTAPYFAKNDTVSVEQAQAIYQYSGLAVI